MEKIFRIGLQTRNYSGKWKEAKRMAKEVYNLTGIKYWFRVRKIYVELGGL